MRFRALHVTFVALAPLLGQDRTASGAEAAEVRSMTLPQAIDYAHAHQPALRAALARVGVFQADAAVTRSRWYPTLVGTAQLLATTTNNTTGSYLPVPGLDNPRVSATRAESAATASLLPSASTLIGAGARQEVFDFGRITAQAAADDLRADAERFSYDSTKLTVDYDVEETYFAVFTAHAVLAASERAYERTIVHRNLARVGVESGLRRPIELTRAEATLDQYDLGRIHARRGMAIAESVLAAAIGLPDRRVDISGPPPAPRESPPFEAALEAATNRNPDLLAARARIRAQKGQTRAIEAESRPNLFVTGAVSGNAGGATPSSGTSAPERGLLPVVPNWDVGLVMAWPLFDATVDARRDRSEVEEDAVREEANVIEQRIAASVEQAYVEVDAARDALPVLRHSSDAAVANYDQANARFEVGLGNAVELADAEQLRTDTEIQLALGTFELARTRAALARLTGESP
jgi:outer membrane protein